MSHLTVSYVNQTLPGTAPAGGVTTAPEGDGNNPLGFIAALFDQLLGGQPALAGPSSIPAPGTPASPAADLLALLRGIAPADAARAGKSTPLSDLGAQLDAAEAAIGRGETLPAADVDALKDAVAALTATLDTVATPPSAPVETTPASLRATVPAPVATPPDAPLDDTAIARLLARLGFADAATEPARPSVASQAETPTAADAITDLRDRLHALSQAVAATAPDLSRQLARLDERLAVLAPAAPAAPELTVSAGAQTDPDTLTIARIVGALLGQSSGPNTDHPAGPSAAREQSAAPQLSDELLQILATLGLSPAPSNASSSPLPTGDVGASTSAVVPVAASTPPAISVPAPLLRLSNQLSTISAGIGDTHPDLAKKLEAVAARVLTADAGPDILGQLTSAAAGKDSAPLERLVQSLIEGRSAPAVAPTAAAPQIAAVSQLPIPAPLAPKPTQSAATEVKAAQPETAPVAADSAPEPVARLSSAPVAREPAPAADPQRPVEAKPASTPADAARADGTTVQAGPQPPAAAAQAARILPAAYQQAVNPINMGQVAFEMVRQVHQGTSRFTIRLDPPELGRVDVKMHVDASGSVNARLTVDRAETLDLFQRDQRSLERALVQAGLDANKTNLEFSLRQNHQNPFAGMMGDDRQHHASGNGTPRLALNETDEAAPLPAITLYRGLASAGGVNIFA